MPGFSTGLFVLELIYLLRSVILHLIALHSQQDCEQWFIDRVIRDRPVPIPSPGILKDLILGMSLPDTLDLSVQV